MRLLTIKKVMFIALLFSHLRKEIIHKSFLFDTNPDCAANTVYKIHVLYVPPVREDQVS